MEILTTCELFEYLVVIGHEPPHKDAYFLIEWNLIYWVWQVSIMTINNVLEVLWETSVQRIKINFAVDDSK